MAEGEHELGREGVKRVQRLLEATMRFDLPYDAYKNEARVTLPMLVEGERKCYDLSGNFNDEEGNAAGPIFIECKNVAGAAGQASEFKEFLARAYSATSRRSGDLGLDPGIEFMWATTCPWKGDGFRDVASREAVLAAVRGADGAIIPDDHNVDEGLVNAVAGRLWVWVVSERQEEMVMGEMMRGYVAAKQQGQRR